MRISAVVSRLLSFSREHGPGDEPVLLNRVIEDVLAFVEPRLKAQRVQLTTTLRVRVLHADGDPIRVLPAGVAFRTIRVNGEAAKLVRKGAWLHLDAREPGVYTATLLVRHNDPTKQAVAVPVTVFCLSLFPFSLGYVISQSPSVLATPSPISPN